ncbi:hypothetical protein HDG37_006644 [Paraburkholderia sp. MM5384-R2]|nr:hypothetical protein [Paraburkholderia sp. MM5384-R2]
MAHTIPAPSKFVFAALLAGASMSAHAVVPGRIPVLEPACQGAGGALQVSSIAVSVSNVRSRSCLKVSSTFRSRVGRVHFILTQ